MLIPREVFDLVRFTPRERVKHDVLEGVFVRRRGTNKIEACATSGRLLGLVEWTEPDWTEFPVVCDDAGGFAPAEGFSAIVPNAACASIQRKIQKAPFKPILRYALLRESDGEKLTAFTTDLDIEYRTTFRRIDVDGLRFPRYESVLERLSGGDVASVKVSPTYMKIAVEGLAKFSSGGVDVMDVSFNGFDKPMVLELPPSNRAAALDRVRVLVMPIVEE